MEMLCPISQSQLEPSQGQSKTSLRSAMTHAILQTTKYFNKTCHPLCNALKLAPSQRSMLYNQHPVDYDFRLLEDACYMLKSDPYSGPARKKLIDGARGILQVLPRFSVFKCALIYSF